MRKTLHRMSERERKHLLLAISVILHLWAGGVGGYIKLTRDAPSIYNPGNNGFQLDCVFRPLDFEIAFFNYPLINYLKWFLYLIQPLALADPPTFHLSSIEKQKWKCCSESLIPSVSVQPSPSVSLPLLPNPMLPSSQFDELIVWCAGMGVGLFVCEPVWVCALN